MADSDTYVNKVVKQHHIHDAIRAGDQQAVKELAAADPELCSVEALHQAVTAGLTDITAVLLEPRTNVYNDIYQTVKPMHTAAAAGHHAVLELLLQHCDQHATKVNNSRWQANRDQVLTALLHSSLETADSSTAHHVVRVLLAAGAKDRLNPSHGMTYNALWHASNSEDEEQQTALATAIEQDNVKVVHQLVTAASVKALRGEYGFDAVHRAAGLQRLPALRLLLATGAAVRDPSHVKPFSKADGYSVDGDVALSRSPLVAALGASIFIDRSPTVAERFSLSCWHTLPSTEPCKLSEQETSCVRALIGAKADVNAQDGMEGARPLCALQVAVWRGCADTVKLLLQHGATAPLAEAAWRLPIHFAAAGGFCDVVAALLDAGADVNAFSRSGCTALHEAVEQGHLDTVNLLIQRGAFVNAVTEGDDLTALHMAVQLAHGPRLDTDAASEAVAALLHAGADINARDYAGRTALHHALPPWQGCLPEAAESDRAAEIVRLLLQRGANHSLEDDEGQTALHVAAARGAAAAGVVRELLRAGADPLAQNLQGQTPLAVAATCAWDSVSSALTVEVFLWESQPPTTAKKLVEVAVATAGDIDRLWQESCDGLIGLINKCRLDMTVRLMQAAIERDRAAAQAALEHKLRRPHHRAPAKTAAVMLGAHVDARQAVSADVERQSLALQQEHTAVQELIIRAAAAHRQLAAELEAAQQQTHAMPRGHLTASGPAEAIPQQLQQRASADSLPAEEAAAVASPTAQLRAAAAAGEAATVAALLKAGASSWVRGPVAVGRSWGRCYLVAAATSFLTAGVSPGQTAQTVEAILKESKPQLSAATLIKAALVAAKAEPIRTAADPVAAQDSLLGQFSSIQKLLRAAVQRDRRAVITALTAELGPKATVILLAHVSAWQAAAAEVEQQRQTLQQERVAVQSLFVSLEAAHKQQISMQRLVQTQQQQQLQHAASGSAAGSAQSPPPEGRPVSARAAKRARKA